jgi:hypothetical protein
MKGGIIISEDGSFYQFGEIKSARFIIAALQDMLPQLIEQEQKIARGILSIEQLEEELQRRREGQLEP